MMTGPDFHKLRINQFWQAFGGRKRHGIGLDPVLKLKALKEMAVLVVPYKNQVTLFHRRVKFNKAKHKLHPFRRFGICFVCGKPATDRHHIIQLQNGGINSKKNLVSLCDGCHCEIHPWMVPTHPQSFHLG